jgi:hypothetical protein
MVVRIPLEVEEVTPQEIMAALREPFAPEKIGWKPGAITKDGTRALALGYIDARDVMDRLDDVVGCENWYDVCEPQGTSVVCRLSVRLSGEWITKADVGSLSGQEDAGDQLKAGYSDAIKRAAIKWGIGRYLYSLPQVWVEYDPQKKRIVKLPDLPPWARPQPKPKVNENLREKALVVLRPAAAKGIGTLETVWYLLSKEMQIAVQLDMPGLKEMASAITDPKTAN